MLGAIAGDIIGSVYEFNNVKTKDFPLFLPTSSYTDDTVLTIAVADAIINSRSYMATFKEYYHRYPYSGYGGRFQKWARSEFTEPYNSFGNGSAMRVSPIGFTANNLDSALQESKRSAEVTHNHPEGIKGAQAVAAAIFLARMGAEKTEISNYIQTTFCYDLSFTLNEIRPNYEYDMTCQGSIPQAIVAFLESTSFEDAIRNAISIGGDSDTIACIVGGIAQAFYGGVPEAIATPTLAKLDRAMRELLDTFTQKYCN